MNFNNAVWIPVFQRHCNCRGLLLLVLVMMPTVLIVSKNPDCVDSPCFEISLLLALLSVSAPFLLYLNLALGTAHLEACFPLEGSMEAHHGVPL